MMMSKKAALEWNINQLVNQQAATLHSSAAYILLMHIIAVAALVSRAACTLKQEQSLATGRCISTFFF